jgi:hypothetical protein
MHYEQIVKTSLTLLTGAWPIATLPPLIFWVGKTAFALHQQQKRTIK